MDRIQKVYFKLKQAGVKYREIYHKALFTTADIEENVPMDADTMVVKNLFLRDSQGKKLFLVVMRYFIHADLVALRAFLNTSKLGFASERRLEENLGVLPGSVSPLSVINDEELKVKVIFDEGLKDYRTICMHPNDNTASVYIALDDLVKFVENTGHGVTYFKFT